MVSLSYIIPTFNNLELLKRCLHSIEPHLAVKDRVIIVDDGSTDETIKYLTENYNYKNKFTILSQTNAGSGSARNLGKKEIETDYVWFVDADDYLVKGAADKVKEVLVKNNYDVLFIGHSVQITPQRVLVKEINFNAADKTELLLTEHYPWNKVIKSNLLHDIHFPNIKMRYVDHATIPAIISLANHIGILRDSLYVYDFSHANNISKNRKLNRDIYTAFQYLEDHCKNNKLKINELELLYVKKFIFDEPYNVKLKLRDIYLNVKQIKNYMSLHVPTWSKSPLLKSFKYQHILQFYLWKGFTGRVMHLSPLLASLLIFLHLMTRRLYVFIRDFKKIMKQSKQRFIDKRVSLNRL